MTDDDDDFHMVINEFITVETGEKFRKELAEAIVDYCKNGTSYLVNAEAGVVAVIEDVYNHVTSGGPDPNILEMFDNSQIDNITSAPHVKALEIALESIHDQIDNPYAIEYSSPKY